MPTLQDNTTISSSQRFRILFTDARWYVSGEFRDLHLQKDSLEGLLVAVLLIDSTDTVLA
jgi:hypothetical protein